jgi:ribosomal protein S17E
MERERINEKGRKCPHCHQIIDQFSDVCPICNTPLTPQLTDKFNTLLKNLEDALYNLKTGENINGAMALIDQYTREAKLNFGNHKKVLAILVEIDTESKRVAENNAVNEIITNLEEALIVLKSGQDINVAKAIIDRYARQAKAEYADNVKVCKLLAEIEVEAKNAEAKAKKAATLKVLAKTVKFAIPFLIVAGIVGLIVKACLPSPDNDPQALMEAVNECIADGDFGQAEAYITAFAQNEGYGPAQDAAVVLVNAYLAQNQLDKAFSYASTARFVGEYTYELTAAGSAIMTKFIEAGRYDDAEKCQNWHGKTSDYYDFLCRCIDHMLETGKTHRVKSFIERKIGHYGPRLTHEEEWQQPAVKERLYKYAGIE